MSSAVIVGGIVLVGHRGIEAAQGVDGVPRMSVGEHDAVGGNQAGQIVAAFGQLVRALAVGRSVLRDRLIERHQRPAAAMGEQDDLGDPGLPAQKIDAGFHVERQLLEIHQRFVVFVARVHAQHQEPAPRQLGAGGMIEVVRGAVHRQNRHVGRSTGIGLVERAFADALERDESRIALRPGRVGSEEERDGSSDCGAQHGSPPEGSFLDAQATVSRVGVYTA
jgi:hypothetical protein